MKFYVATAFGNKDEASEVMRALEDKGHSITYDWTKYEKDISQMEEGEERQLVAIDASLKDYQGVVDCDVLIVIDKPLCISTHTELGIALPIKKRVVVVHNEESRNLFFNLPFVHLVDTIEEAMDLF